MSWTDFNSETPDRKKKRLSFTPDCGRQTVNKKNGAAWHELAKGQWVHLFLEGITEHVVKP